MSSMLASAITSASPIFWQVMPLAPASSCSLASIGLLWVLMCGRLATPAASQVAWIRAMLRSTRSMSITAQGVPYSRAILAARGVVIRSTQFQYSRHCERNEAIHRPAHRKDGLLRRFASRNDDKKHLSLFYLFP